MGDDVVDVVAGCAVLLSEVLPPVPHLDLCDKKKTIEFKLRIYEINIVKKKDDAFV